MPHTATGHLPGRQVHKFGGSSLADPNCYRRVAGIIEQESDPRALIVVSAAGKTTNRLLQILELSEAGDDAAVAAIQGLRAYHLGLIEGVLDGPARQQLSLQLMEDIDTIACVLKRSFDRYERNGILANGEVWSARLLAALLTERGNQASWLDARRFLSAEEGALARVNEGLSREKLREVLAGTGEQRVVVTGFIAADSEGRTLLLGRNGSDYSATLLGALAEAESTAIWSDVAGVYSADPRCVKDAKLLERLSLAEANELARLGAPVLHSRTLQPLMHSQQKLVLRSSYAPTGGASHILRRKSQVKGARIVTSLEQIALIELRIQPDCDYDQSVIQLESLLAAQQLSPLVSKNLMDRRIVRLAYTLEMAPDAHQFLLQQQTLSGLLDVVRRDGFSLIGLVGTGVCDNAEQCHRFYRLLVDQPLEFIYTAPEGLSLVAVVREITLEPLLIALHHAMFQQTKRVGLVVLGKGNIGSQWLKLLAKEKHHVELAHQLTLTLYGLFDSRGGVLCEEGLDPLQVLDSFDPQPVIWAELLVQLEQHPFDELIVLDLTASETVSSYYTEFAQIGAHLITANKFAGAAESAFYQRVRQSFAEHQVQWRYNATVGAGLPVQSCIRMMLESGDRVHGISGIFSGTLSWLFQQYDGSVSFSELVDQAWQHGLTEPDPREDLTGHDVRRKLLILAREAGLELEPEHISLQSLVPANLADIPLESFFEQLPELDHAVETAFEEAKAHGKVLRYVARLDRDGSARVGLDMLTPDHPFANLRPCDNIFSIETDFYRTNPLILQGPGAGREVTAAAVQADLWKICATLK
jgi:aspartokinase/homoserine dehydrogenase 2